MSFVDVPFAYFLPAFFAAWYATRGKYPWQMAVMLAGSLVFYSYNRWWTLSIIISYCLVDWLVGLWLARTRYPKHVLTLGLTFNLGILAYWKYAPLVVHTAADLFGLPVDTALVENWTTPIGISFYAFSGISYMVDVYRGDVAAERNLWRYCLFTSFFPHLVAGPILRAREFLVHLRPEALPSRLTVSWEGTFLIARGFFKKMVLADTIAAGIDPFFANVTDPSTAGVWSLPYVYLYALQIYFDFSGYTDIARGLGLWFGFRWPENFSWPYLATSVQEFWRRWHMTLSRFLRDYLYIPLGGGHRGPWRAALNLMITMLLGGLWHGASWSFVLWGGLHGSFLVINRLWATTPLQRRLALLQGTPALAWTAVRIALTFHAVCLAWCFFRLTSVRESLACIGKWFAFETAFAGGSADLGLWVVLAMYIGLAAIVRLVLRDMPLREFERGIAARPLWRGACWGGAISLFALAILLAPGGNKAPFIYFQF